MQQCEQLVAEFEQALLSVDRVRVRALLAQAVATLGPVEIADTLIGPAFSRIGAGWEQGKVALSQVYMSGRICEEVLATVLPATVANRKDQPRIAIAVLEDHHQLGSRIVASMLRANGFEVVDYGHGLGTDTLAERAAKEGIEILLVSALMLPSALSVKRLRSRLTELGANSRIVVGGAPFVFDAMLWKEVGADAMGKNASEAVEIVTRLTGGRS